MSSVIKRHELSDEEWELIEPMLPPQQTAGRHYRDHRLVLNGMLYWLHTGVPWRDLPERFGPWETVYSRFRRWSRNGLWDQILARLQRQLDGLGQIDWELWCIDGSNIRAHKAAAGAGKKTGQDAKRRRTVRSRPGAFQRRIRQQDPPGHRRSGLAVEITAGQVHESRRATTILDSVRIRRLKGRPRQRPEAVAADKGFSYPHIRQWLRSKHIQAIIPERKDQRARRAKRPGRRPSFDREAYRRRNVVERFVGWLKEARRVATRYEKLALHYLGVLKLAMIRKYLKLTVSNTA